VKLLVINADDFGLDPAVNAAVAKGHTEGVLTSASLMVNAPHVDKAAAFAKSHPQLGVGIHLCLVDGRPVSGASEIEALVDGQGNLPRGPFELSRMLRRDERVAAAIEVELRAQIQKFTSTGLKPTHLDSHMHTHMHPRILPIVATLARENGIAYVRAPVEPLARSLRCNAERLPRKLARWLVFASLGARSKRVLRQAGLRTADQSIGVLDAGHVTEPFLTAYLPLLPDGLTEIFMHPAAEASVTLATTQHGYENVAELAALCSSRVRELIDRSGIRLTNFGVSGSD
jgi:hopanoid biosynthesis associated protein HpnK